MNGLNVSRDTFDTLDEESRSRVLFDLVRGTYECTCGLDVKVQVLEKKLERKKVFDATVSGFTGMAGGALAVLGLWLKGLIKSS